jgi:ATP-dependent helicase YprA (DUF1998 family)
MTDAYSLQQVSRSYPETLKQYLEAQYHIWDEQLVADRRRLLDEPGVVHQPPYIEATPSYRVGQPYKDLKIPKEVQEILSAACADSARTGIPRLPYAHQARALELFFEKRESPCELVVSTGTGSGKTETFLMPIIGSMAMEKSTRASSYSMSAVRTLLMYPMNALVNDQVARLRRLLGADEVARALRRQDGRAASFGFYTSRTPYPGKEDPARTKRDVGSWIKQFFARYEGLQGGLKKAGKWPAKDLQAFAENFTTLPSDVELITRQEMQAAPPDILVTNYSMLEYMLLRPVDAGIFDRTQAWLSKDRDRNTLNVVLDEAHLYQGAQGSEVALLLRRLSSRLRAHRQQVRFILTSASLASESIRAFASQLTGALDGGRGFEIITGQLDKKDPGQTLSAAEAAAFATVNISALHEASFNLDAAQAVIQRLAQALGSSVPNSGTLSGLQNECFKLLEGARAHQELAARIMGTPGKYTDVAHALFGDRPDATVALDGLLAATTFARRESDERVLLPSRAHFLFRGLEGVFACCNPQCTARVGSKEGPLGRLYEKPQRFCSCGARVYELLTHRDCGAAYIRAYVREDDRSFLWHEPSSRVIERTGHLLEVHALVETERCQRRNFDEVWLHATTGQLLNQPPANTAGFLPLLWPRNKTVPIKGRSVLTFDRQCPVCLGTWRDENRPKIMDLVTKGEDPFAHLIATQVRLQPPSIRLTAGSPNAGRKSLLFSDGRQKAARLARDVPRVIELDAFRQSILLAAQKLQAVQKQPRFSDALIYPAFVSVVLDEHLNFFDGSYAIRLKEHKQYFADNLASNLKNAFDADEPWLPDIPSQFRADLMRLLGNRHYSLYALGLGYVVPSKKAQADLERELKALGLAADEIRALAILWIDKLLADFSLYASSKVKKPARERASGHPISEIGSKTGFYSDQKRFLKQTIDVDPIDAAFKKVLTSGSGRSEGHRLLDENFLCLEPALTQAWYRCDACTYLAPITWRGVCAWCGEAKAKPVSPESDIYLRARKAFWRVPVERALAGTQKPFTMSVEEHTAQLNFRDRGTVESTTETYERRFRDILLAEENAIDVLSCTTTMEVGIDIGSLIGVGLGNMPPSRHNYQQRAGRAGRRGSAISTVITYAQHNPHDAHFFENPKDLIAGAARPAGIDIKNPAIVRRHVYAELVQEYFNSETIRDSKGGIFSTLGKTAEFFNGTGEGSLPHFSAWLVDESSSATRERIKAWLPPESGLNVESCISSLLGTLSADLQAKFEYGIPQDEEDLIEFFFSHSVLPAYAFPRDLIALEIGDPAKPGEAKERPQQSAAIALSEYAPGRTVVVNKKTYRVGAVTSSTLKDDVNRARALFSKPPQFLQCSACLNTTNSLEDLENETCPVCAAAEMKRITVIQPQVVWPEKGEEIDELDDEQIFTDTTVAQLPIPSSDSAFKRDEQFGAVARLRFGRDVPLVIVNRGLLVDGDPSGFEVCKDCGFVPLSGQPFPTAHDRCYQVRGTRDRKCNGKAARVYLGYEFHTDVLLLHIPLRPPFISDLSDSIGRAALQTAAHSLANAMSIAGASELGIDQRELQSGHRLRRLADGGSFVDIYVYDTLAGGAGYSRLVGDHFSRIFEAAVERLANCSCGGSCTACLRTYANRMTHAQLDRKLALGLARYASTGSAPTVGAPNDQWVELRPLLEMLEMAGWSTSPSKTYGAAISRQGESRNLAVRPALIDPGAVPPYFGSAVSFSSFEIDKDLPSCLIQV